MLDAIRNLKNKPIVYLSIFTTSGRCLLNAPVRCATPQNSTRTCASFFPTFRPTDVWRRPPRLFGSALLLNKGVCSPYFGNPTCSCLNI
ncbi:hypothetical protein CEXT_243701 [Caerostris extrusa]|uniref:Uncharacterized protein n=1 Tax=Caerostris extrusa TaxID=172846 RepID=A0AAV4RYZ7_CAEEX|nr:hypothetical protein CEXT_243701 [Caerostris extrusa]